MKMIWSEYPQEAYTVTLKSGIVTGLGAHSSFDNAPGAWNLFWLTYSNLDNLAYPQGDPLEYLYSCTELAVSIGASLQIVPGILHKKCDVTYGTLALNYTPLEVIKFVEADKGHFLLTAYYGDSWLTVAKNNALKYKVRHDNLIHHDFRR